MKILLTGGGGRLGTELRALLLNMGVKVVAPPSGELDITESAQVENMVRHERPSVIVHAAAYTDVGSAERDRERCWLVNVVGTRNMAQAANAVGVKLVQISTDYVFSGDQGNYREVDTPGPVVNFYALTKLVAEEAARAATHHLIIRTSFRPREFQYPIAYSDVFTGQDYVDIIAPQIAVAVTHSPQIDDTVLHIVTERKSVYELARRRRPDVREGSRSEAGVTLPGDVSLNTERWDGLYRELLIPAVHD